MKVKRIFKRMIGVPGLLLLLFYVGLSSCSKEVEEENSASLIKKYGLAGKYRFQVIPTLMGTVPMTTGTIDGTLTDEGNGVLRLRFTRFNAPPMPFNMTVDLQMTFTESSRGLHVHNVEGKSFFDADPPEGVDEIDPDDVPGGMEIPSEALKEGLHSNGKSVVSGEYKPAPDGTMQFDLELDPAVGLPVIIRIETLKKLN
ncbi:MAG: hypothetical protein AB2L24_17585 [Mangrovibacterium sp.]